MPEFVSLRIGARAAVRMFNAGASMRPSGVTLRPAATNDLQRPKGLARRERWQQRSARTATGALDALIAAAGLTAAAQAKPPRAVIELFTSQGCSSCPPADELLAKLATEDDLIALSLPVDYWDRLGWKDTLAKHAFTERQVAYSNVRGDGEVYTPQAVVNGKEHAVGSERSAIDAAIAETASSLSVPLER